MTGKRLAALIRIRDARPARLAVARTRAGPRRTARRPGGSLNRLYDVFVQQYGLINKTTVLASPRRRAPSSSGCRTSSKFIEDPDAMLVMALEDCDPTSGTAVKAAIMMKDVVGRAPPVTTVAECRGGAARLARPEGRGGPRLHRVALRRPTRPASSRSWATSSTRTRRPRRWQTADDYLSGNVREKLASRREGRARVRPERRGPCGPCSPRTCSRARSTPTSGPRGSPRATSGRSRPSSSASPASSIAVGHLKKDALWSVEAGYDAASGVPPRPTTARRGPTAPRSSSRP